MSLLDMIGSLGRVDGGIGLTLQSPNFIIAFSDECEENFLFAGPSQYEYIVKNVIKDVSKYYGLHFPNLEIIVEQIIPEHIGMGSKTQFLMAIALGLCTLRNIEYKITDLAKIVGRGGTSGIGYMAFETGKFIVDLGHSFGPNHEKETFLPSSASNAPPAMPFVQLHFPEEWDILLLQLDVEPGANNLEEVNIFQKYCPLPTSEVQAISHRILMQLIPSIISQDLEGLASALSFVSTHGFKNVEISLQHQYVQDTITFISEYHKVPVGMSSFGPTIFIISDTSEKTEKIIESLEKFLGEDSNAPKYSIIKTKPNNSGHSIMLM